MLPYLDLPLQHSHPEVLRAMNRPWQADVNDRLLDQIRDQLPDAVLRTTLIVGFPGETEEHFQHLMGFLERQRFDHVGVFTFSPEDGTAAADLPDRVDPEVAQARQGCPDGSATTHSEERNSRWVGRTVDVLIEQHNPQTGEMIGRCARFAPEVDGEYGCNPAPMVNRPRREAWCRWRSPGLTSTTSEGGLLVPAPWWPQRNARVDPSQTAGRAATPAFSDRLRREHGWVLRRHHRQGLDSDGKGAWTPSCWR